MYILSDIIIQSLPPFFYLLSRFLFTFPLGISRENHQEDIWMWICGFFWFLLMSGWIDGWMDRWMDGFVKFLFRGKGGGGRGMRFLFGLDWFVD